MLQIKNISKQYKTGDLVQNALSDVSLNFRNNEFVSILGPSGSGKTTLLNIIGGLDRYDSGDLIINNVSTKDYKDRDWDSYRNHTVGFVFQSYNLIQHQTVLANVELALTISGISPKERKRRAKEALEKVGLSEHIHKKPNQMSGGQMQRVAIARALVNDPDILLADEPTGALDTETSLQVMALLKEVANDRLVIMVTHNPDLANEHSTRIVNLKDGKITGDTNPFEIKKEKQNKAIHKNLGKASMSFITALSLSLNNLMTKKGRTILTSFAGSIGIIGIALILSLSTGFQNYIDKIQEDTLTSYPLTVGKDTADSTSLLLSMTSKGKTDDVPNGTVIENQVVTDMFTKIGTNDLPAFRKYLDDNKETVDKYVTQIQNKYSINPLIYTTDVTNKIVKLNPNSLVTSLSGSSSTMSMGMSASMSIFTEMNSDITSLEKNYKLLTGRWFNNYDEVVLILPEEKSMSDLLVYFLGLRDADELSNMISKLMKDEKIENDNEPLSFTYNELMNIPLKLVDPSSLYKYNSKYKIYEDMSEDEKYLEKVYNKSVDLKIVGIITAKDQNSALSFMSGIGYTPSLTKYVIETASKSKLVKKQLENEDINVFNNKSFDDKSKDLGIDFEDLITIDTKKLSSAFGVNINEKDIQSMTEGYMKEIQESITADTTDANEAFINGLSTLSKGLLDNYIKENGNVGIAIMKLSEVEDIVNSYMESSEATKVLKKLEKEYVLPTSIYKSMYTALINGFLTQYISVASTNTTEPEAFFAQTMIDTLVDNFIVQDLVIQTSEQVSIKMVEASMQKTILTKVGQLTSELVSTMSNAFKVDESSLASAFKFNLGEDQMRRIMESMSTVGQTQNSLTNLISLGYQDLDFPTSISFYFKDFDSKEKFIDFIEEYNKKMENKDEEKVIKYSDLTGVLMSSVKTIVDSVSYVLIAFVSISLVVSSIMIGIITYISVLERTKEIGILRAIGASKKNISSIFNAETFIVGLFAGILGIGISLLLLIPINAIIRSLTGNINITAILPIQGAIILVILSVILTLIGGLIPSKQAAKKDPVIALRTE